MAWTTMAHCSMQSAWKFDVEQILNYIITFTLPVHAMHMHSCTCVNSIIQCVIVLASFPCPFSDADLGMRL